MARPPLHPAFAALLSSGPGAVGDAGSATAAGDVGGLVLDLAFDKGPAFFDGALALDDDAELSAQGFSADVKNWSHPASGPLAFRSRDTPGLQITFGGAPGRLCQLNMLGGDAPALLDAIRERVGELPYDLRSDAARSGAQRDGSEIETFTATLAPDALLLVQFVRATVAGQPLAGFILKDTQA